MSRLSYELTNWLRNMSMVLATLLLVGCSNGVLLVNKSEVKPIQRLKVVFVQLTPKADGSPSYAYLSSELAKSGYYNGNFQHRYSTALVEIFQANEIQAEYEGAYLGKVNVAPAFSHTLVIAPTTFSVVSEYKNPVGALMRAEMQLIDHSLNKAVWKKKEDIPISERVYLSRTGETTLINWHELGFVKLRHGIRSVSQYQKILKADRISNEK